MAIVSNNPLAWMLHSFYSVLIMCTYVDTSLCPVSAILIDQVDVGTCLYLLATVLSHIGPHMSVYIHFVFPILLQVQAQGLLVCIGPCNTGTGLILCYREFELLWQSVQSQVTLGSYAHICNTNVI